MQPKPGPLEVLYGVHKETRLSVSLFLKLNSGIPAQVSESLRDQN